MKGKLPDWVLRHKQKNTQIVRIGNSYYLYRITSRWDPKKGRARKITEKYLGKITEEGLIKPKYERVLEGMKGLTVKEFGATQYVVSIAKDIIELLRIYFPDIWKSIFVFSLMRLFYSSPLKNVIHHFRASYISEIYPDASVSLRSLSGIIKEVGAERQRVIGFLRNFLKGRKYQVIDITQVFFYSENLISAALGYNSHGEYIPQVNLVVVFGLKEREPGFFRIVPGSIRDVSLFKRTLEEAGISAAVIICDKGFYSEENIRFLEDNNLRFIMPLKRNSSLIDYSPLISGRRRDFGGYFLFEKRVIWYSEKVVEGKRLILYFDERLRAEEEKDIVSHIEEGRIKIGRLYETEHRLGSISVLTNTEHNANEVFELLKGRIEIEQAFDTFKNLLNADRTYIRDDEGLNGWMFVNFVSLILYYRIYNELRKARLLKNYSVKDLLMHLKRIYILKMPDGWQVSEVPKTTRKIVERLGLDLHIT